MRACRSPATTALVRQRKPRRPPGLRHNRLLEMDGPRFVQAVTESLPSRPPNVERIVEINRRPAGATPAEPLEVGTLASGGQAQV